MDDGLLERGCIRETRRADDVAESLLSLAAFVPEHSSSIDRVYETIWRLERLLTRLPAELYVHADSVHHVRRDLFLLLATMQSSLDHMRSFLNRADVVGYGHTWVDMNNYLRNETGSSINTWFLTFDDFLHLIRENLRGCVLLSLKSYFD